MSTTKYKAQFVEPQVDHALIDVRRPDEYAVSHLVGSVNIPLHEIDERLGEIPTGKPVVVYCRSGNRSGQAAELLVSKGFANVLNAGGLADLAEAGLPVQVLQSNEAGR